MNDLVKIMEYKIDLINELIKDIQWTMKGIGL